MIKLKTTIFILLIIVSSFSFAEISDDAIEFLSKSDHKTVYEQFKRLGKFEKFREHLISLCEEQLLKGTIKPNCECVRNELNNLSDEVIFYESIVAHRQYEERYSAAEDGDLEKLEDLNKDHGMKKNSMEKIETKCGVK